MSKSEVMFAQDDCDSIIKSGSRAFTHPIDHPAESLLPEFFVFSCFYYPAFQSVPDEMRRPHSSLAEIPDPQEGFRVLLSENRHKISECHRVVAKSILGEFHHEHQLKKIAA